MKSAAKPATSVQPAEQRSIAEQRLAEAQKFQAELRTENPLDNGAAGEAQRLADRLVAAYGDRLRLLDDLAEGSLSAAEKERRQTLLAEFDRPPPYNALRVEIVRDEYDRARNQEHSMVAQQRAVETQKGNLIEAQQKLSEGLRLAQDRLAAARNDEDREKARQGVKIADLRMRLADAELGSVAIGVDLSRREAENLVAWSEQLLHLLNRIQSQQKLTDADLEKTLADLRDRLGKLAVESDRLAAASATISSELERMGRAGKIRDPKREAILEATLETKRIGMMTLGWLQGLVQFGMEGWRQFHILLTNQDPAARQGALAAMEKIRKELVERRSLLDELLSGARVAVREQEGRYDASLLDKDKAAYEQRILELLKERVVAYQRVELTAIRVQRRLERWLADHGAGERRDRDSLQLRAAGAAALARDVWNFELFAVEESTLVDGKAITTSYGITVGKSIGAVLLYLLCYAVASLLMRRMQRIMVSRFGVQEQVAIVIRRWVMIAVAVVLVILTLNLARIPLTVFAFMGGALAIGIGFGTQTIIKNVISGIIILFERKIRVGDIVVIGGTTGHITAVDLRASTVRSFDGVEALIPNSTFLENPVVNWTYSNQRVRREIRIGVAYGSSVREAAEIIARCAMDHGLVLKTPPPEVYFEDFGDNALLLALIFWIELSGPNVSGRRVDSDLRFAIEKHLAVAGIQIPFPQRDVHVDAARPVPVRVITEASDGTTDSR